jgi:hypothetical protein
MSRPKTTRLSENIANQNKTVQCGSLGSGNGLHPTDRSAFSPRGKGLDKLSEPLAPPQAWFTGKFQEWE